ncbi:MAG: carbohydrate ABC transporter permease [Alphaproteobacteria bacterium]|nr:carbohydrate ABC transporter permease [Alphaproteobacteria bacterium]
MTVLSLLFLVPYWMILSGSFTDELALVESGFGLIPAKFSIAAYKFILESNPLMLRSILNSIILTLSGTAVTLVVTTLYAYPLSRGYLRGRKFFSLYMIFTMIFGGGLIPYYLTVTKFFTDTILAIIIPGAMAPFYAILLRNYFLTIPDSLEEAARIDGANHFRILVMVYVPLSLPVIASIVLFAAVSNWNNWVGPMLFIETKEKYPIQYLIQQLLTNITSIYGGSSGQILPSESVKMASVVLGSLPIILVYPFLQRYFISGIVLGGVKE